MKQRTWAPVAQLDRASASGVEGHEFESRRVYHFFCLFCLRIPVLRHFCFLLQKAAKWCKSNKKSGHDFRNGETVRAI